MNEQLLENLLKQSMEMEKISRETKPYARPKKDYNNVLYKYNMAKLTCNPSNIGKGQNGFRMNQVIAKRHSCLKDLKNLEPIVLKDMKVNNIHYGKYLECKTIAEPFVISAIQFLVTDKNNEIENLSVYNHYLKDHINIINTLIPIGSRLIIKEPFLKLMATGEKESCIRIDSPTDLIILEKEETDIKSADTLIEQGNKNFSKKEYLLAKHLYSKALNKQKDSRAYLNRSASNLKLENYYQAFKDAEEALNMTTDNKTKEKAYFRMAKSSYLMRKFEDAENFFSLCLETNKENKEAFDELNKTKARLREAETGIYDFKFMIEESNKKFTRFDVADFYSKNIHVTDIPKKQKGVVALNEIKKGTLLIVSKAFSIAHIDECKGNTSITFNFCNKLISTEAQTKNFELLIAKIQCDPVMAKQVYKLYAGEEYDRNECVNELTVDVSRLEAIEHFNSFTSENYFEKKEVNPTYTRKASSDNSGLWIYPSYFNHSCISNTIGLFFGDLMVLHAKQDIKKGEEITIRYTYSDKYDEREKTLKNKFNFVCDCELCELDRKDPLRKERGSLVTKNISKRSYLFSSSEHLTECIEDVKKLRKAYGSRTKLQSDLVLTLQNLAVMYAFNLQFDKTAQTMEEIYEIAKHHDVHIAIISLIEASFAYEICAMNKNAKKCVKKVNDFFQNNQAYFDYALTQISERSTIKKLINSIN